MRLQSPWISAVFIAAAAMFIPAVASADAQYYRYSVSTYEPGPPKYTGKVPSPNVKGAIREVQRDAKGRVIRVVSWRDGKKLGETVYQYSGNAKLSSGYKSYRAGELRTIAVYKRDPKGNVIREDDRTAQGALSEYTLCTYLPHEIDCSDYDPSGTFKSKDADFYNGAGILIRERSYDTKDETSYYEREYDTATGLETVTRKVAAGKVVVIDKYTRDTTGDLLRLDMYDPSTNKPYGYREFVNGLRAKDSYHFLDGTTKQIDYAYDGNRQMTSAKLTQNGQFICTFSFDRLADGTIKRSLAKGPDGQLWAEYPNAMVTNVNKDGSAVDGVPGTIYKTGDWWSDQSGKT